MLHHRWLKPLLVALSHLGHAVSHVVYLKTNKMTSMLINIASKSGCCQASRCGGPMVSALVSGWSGLGLSHGWRHCIVFSGKTLNSYSASLQTGVQMGTGELNAGGNLPMD